MRMLRAWVYQRYHDVLRRWRLRGWLARMQREERYWVGGVEVLRELRRFGGLGGNTGYRSRERVRLRDVAVGWRRHIGEPNGGGGTAKSVSEKGGGVGG
jgi:hypothetical protein